MAKSLTPQQEKLLSLLCNEREEGRQQGREIFESLGLDCLKGTDLSGRNLRNVDVRCVDLSEADLRETDLRSANLRFADLRSADLCSAKLRGTSLIGANLKGANLDGAVYNTSTQWPDNFDPKSAGAVLKP